MVPKMSQSIPHTGVAPRKIVAMRWRVPAMGLDHRHIPGRELDPHSPDPRLQTHNQNRLNLPNRKIPDR